MKKKKGKEQKKESNWRRDEKQKRKNASQMKPVVPNQKMADIISVKKNKNRSTMHNTMSHQNLLTVDSGSFDRSIVKDRQGVVQANWNQEQCHVIQCQ